MKKFILTLTIIGTIAPVMAMQTTFNGNPITSVSEDRPVKVYNSAGSLQYTMKKQSNGTTKVYNKYDSYQGEYRQDGSKLKYYPKN